jgi:hypothetical protein
MGDVIVKKANAGNTKTEVMPALSASYYIACTHCILT